MEFNNLLFLSEFKDDSIEGIRTIQFPDGTIYSGEFINGKINGKGTLTFSNGEEFKGNFKNGRLQGQGNWSDRSGATFEGRFKNGKFNGVGTLKQPEETKYIGEFKEGKYNGKGIYLNVIGVKYEGEFKDGKFHGEGKLESPDGGGSEYIGEFKEHKFYGKGSLSYKSGTKYNGDFINNNYHGKGTLITQEGDIYIGEFKDHRFNGNGTLNSRDGYEYRGEFKNGKFVGAGQIIFDNYNSYKVFFKDGVNINSPQIPFHLEEKLNKKYYSEPQELYYLFFDTETTGLPQNWKAPVTDFDNWPRLVQLAYLCYDKIGNKISEGDFIIRPDGFNIPLSSTKIHGISNEKAINEGESLDLVLEHFVSLINESVFIVAHNMAFDEMVVGAELLRNGMQNVIEKTSKICTMEKSTKFCAINGSVGYKWPSLSELHFKLFGEEIEEEHDAAVDVNITAKCFWELKRKGIIEPNNIDALFFRGMTKFRNQVYLGAIEDFTKSIELEPKDASILYFRGLAKKNIRDYIGAINDFDKVIEIDPNHKNAYADRDSAKNWLKSLKKLHDLGNRLV